MKRVVCGICGEMKAVDNKMAHVIKYTIGFYICPGCQKYLQDRGLLDGKPTPTTN